MQKLMIIVSAQFFKLYKIKQWTFVDITVCIKSINTL